MIRPPMTLGPHPSIFTMPAGSEWLSHAGPQQSSPNGSRTMTRAPFDSLDELGIHFATGLSSFGRDCLRHWQPLLAPLRDQPFDILEIGVGDGASLRVWRDWFPHARLVGLDARRIALNPPIANCTIVQGRQTDPAVLRPLIQSFQFRLIVDDGSPRPPEKIDTFLALFPWMPPGSIYLCPDPEVIPAASGVTSPSEPEHFGAPDPAWFANLGIAIARSVKSAELAGLLSPLDQAIALASGVHLLRGSVAVTT